MVHYCQLTLKNPEVRKCPQVHPLEDPTDSGLSNLVPT